MASLNSAPAVLDDVSMAETRVSADSPREVSDISDNDAQAPPPQLGLAALQLAPNPAPVDVLGVPSPTITDAPVTPSVTEPWQPSADAHHYAMLKAAALTPLPMTVKPPVAKQQRKPRRTCGQFMKKYCCHGQLIPEAINARGEPPADMHWFKKKYIWNRPKSVTAMLPLTIVTMTWLTIMLYYDLWFIFGPNEEGTYGYWLTITMAFGSFVAGATSEGGGSVAFPIMTLVLGLRAAVARDFSLMIQSIGMTSAAFTVFYSRITIETTTLIYGSIGGAAGIFVGLEWVVPDIPDDYSKMIFVSIWLAFAITLFRLNRQKKRKTWDVISNPTTKDKAILLFVGFVGGNMSALAGSGIDIATFSVLTLWFRLTEKTATPTSVVLMAGNTCMGFFYRGVVQGAIDQQTYQFWACAVPIVCIGAPVGAFVSSYFHRQVLACFVYVTDSVQFIAACVLTTLTLDLALTTGGTLLLCLTIFSLLMHFGNKKLVHDTAAKEVQLTSVKVDTSSVDTSSSAEVVSTTV